MSAKKASTAQPRNRERATETLQRPARSRAEACPKPHAARVGRPGHPGRRPSKPKLCWGHGRISLVALSWRALSEAPRHSFFATPPGGPSDPSRALPPRRSSLCPTVPPSPPGARALLPITRARGSGEPSWTPPPLPPRPALLTPLPGGPLHPPSALALWDPMEPSRRRSDGDPSSPVGWRALRSEGWKWEGSRTDPSRSGRVEGWRVEGWRGG